MIQKISSLLQTRGLTAMDSWLLLCQLFVALATFEYAVLLGVKFGRQDKARVGEKNHCQKMADEKCRKIDRYALRLFFGLHTLAVAVYFFVIYS